MAMVSMVPNQPLRLPRASRNLPRLPRLFKSGQTRKIISKWIDATMTGKLNSHLEFMIHDSFFSGFATRAIHAGNQADPVHGGVTPAIDLSSTYV